MTTIPSPIILADTNAVYKLFFFVEKGLVASSNINIQGFGKIEFHPIVKDEVEAHTTAWRLSSQYGIKSADYPAFLETVGEGTVKKIELFVKNNISNTINPVDTTSQKYINKKRIYEDERKDIQKEWVSQGVSGKKVRSKPSINDYSVLFSADCYKHKILTNDEILLAVATEFLDAGFIFKTEDALNAIYKANPACKPDLEEVIRTLSSLNEAINQSRVFQL